MAGMQSSRNMDERSRKRKLCKADACIIINVRCKVCCKSHSKFNYGFQGYFLLGIAICYLSIISRFIYSNVAS